jgi:hypothetical protein
MARGKLILETDVRSMALGSNLKLAPGDIITPAALDTAHERGIRVWHGPEKMAGPQSHDCLWHKMLAEPGKYLVEVKDGAAMVWKLADSGPVAFGRDRLENHN